mgnify:CR=1 FL=1|tara:strand:- start:627 stop:869 length:243 start_codon:yes stop_codon:yes gene_type:complete
MSKIITESTIKETHKHFINIYKGCIDEVLSGEVKVNDQKKYFENCNKAILKHEKGEGTNNLTFMQRAYYLQEGETIALLP